MLSHIKNSKLLSEYGMIFVLLLLGLFFTFATIKPQSASGHPAGLQLAEQIISNNTNHAILIVSTSTEDQSLKKGFQNTLTANSCQLQIIESQEPSVTKKALLSLVAKVPSNTTIVCSQKTGNWTFYKSIPHFKSSEILIPRQESRSSFLQPSNLKTLPDKTAKTAIIAIGMTMIIITAGIDLSVGSLVALSTVVATLLLQNIFNNSSNPLLISLSFLGGILTCGFLGLISGILTTYLKIPAFIATLAMMLIAKGWALNLADNQTIKVGLPDIGWLGQNPHPIILLIILYTLAYILMHKTVLGRQIYAIGGNPEAARLSGVPVHRVLITVYVISGVMAGIAGVVMASELNSGSGEFGETWELNVIAAVVVGGTSLMGGQGKIIGTLIGCVIIEVINNGMNLMAIGSNTQKVVLGLVILMAITLDKIKKGELVLFSRSI